MLFWPRGVPRFGGATAVIAPPFGSLRTSEGEQGTPHQVLRLRSGRRTSRFPCRSLVTNHRRGAACRARSAIGRCDSGSAACRAAEVQRRRLRLLLTASMSMEGGQANATPGPSTGSGRRGSRHRAPATGHRPAYTFLQNGSRCLTFSSTEASNFASWNPWGCSGPVRQPMRWWTRGSL